MYVRSRRPAFLGLRHKFRYGNSDQLKKRWSILVPKDGVRVVKLAIDLLHETGPTNSGPDLMGTVPDATSRKDTSCASKLGGYAVVPVVSCIHYWSVRVTEDVGPETCD